MKNVESIIQMDLVQCKKKNAFGNFTINIVTVSLLQWLSMNGSTMN